MNNKLKDLAAACDGGACNVKALINILSDAIMDMDQVEIRNSVEVKIVVGQISFLLGESLGPSEKALADYHESR